MQCTRSSYGVHNKLLSVGSIVLFMEEPGYNLDTCGHLSSKENGSAP